MPVIFERGGDVFDVYQGNGTFRVHHKGQDILDFKVAKELAPGPDPDPEPTPDPDPAPDPDPTPEPPPEPDPAPPPAQPTPPPTTPNVSNDAEFVQALSNANEGDTISLAPGNYSKIDILGKNYGSGRLIIRSADRADPAVLPSYQLRSSSNITLDGLKVVYEGGQYEFTWANNLKDSPGISILNVEHEGVMKNGAGDGIGLRSRNCDDLLVDRSKFHKYFRGAWLGEANRLAFTGNEVTNIRSDGLNPDRVDDMLIQGNWFHDFKSKANSGDHRDMIQVIGAAGPSRVIKFYGNLCDRGNGDYAQGEWVGGDGRDSTQNHDLFEFVGNYLANGHSWGIGTFGVANLLVDGNVCALNADPNNPYDGTPTINVKAGNGIVRNNRSSSITLNNVSQDGINGNIATPVTYSELIAAAHADPALAHHFG